MKMYQDIHKANTELSDLGRGECVMVVDRVFRVVNVLGAKVLKAQQQNVGDAGVGYIPGDRYFNQTSRGGKATHG